MSKYSQTVEYQLRTSLDASGIAKLQAELNKTKAILEDLNRKSGDFDGTFGKSVEDLKRVQSLLTTSYNPKMGMLDLTTFNKGLKASNTSLLDLKQSFYAAGTQGQKSFANVLGQLGQLDTGLKATSSTMDKILNTVGNTVRWGIVASGFNMVRDSVQQSVTYLKELDDSLTQIMLVTDYSRKQMNEYAKSANEAAKAVGLTTTPMTNGTLVFAQQGFNLKDSAQLATLSAKLANASQQDTKDTSDQITAIMNAYNLSGDVEKLHAALDSWAKVANVSAADVKEIAGAAQRVASAASATDVSLDQLNAQIATIETVTREAPEQIGNGLKTLYGRFSDIKAGKTLEDGVDLGKVTSALEKFGVQVLDGDGKLRGVGNIMEDLMKVWKSIDSTQKAAIAQTVAGKFQLSRFEALMNRGDLYDEYKKASQTADGTLDQMNEEAINSMAGKSKQILNNVEGITGALFNTDDVYPVLDGVRDLLGLTKEFIDAVGGGKTVMLGVYSLMTRMFGDQMASGISNIIKNMNTAQMIQNNNLVAMQQAREMGLFNDEVNSSLIDPYFDNVNPYLGKTLDFIKFGIENRGNFSTNEIENYTDALQKTVNLEKERLDIESKIGAMMDVTNIAYGEEVVSKDEMTNKLFFNDFSNRNAALGYDVFNDKDALEFQKQSIKQAYEGLSELKQQFSEIFNDTTEDIVGVSDMNYKAMGESLNKVVQSVSRVESETRDFNLYLEESNKDVDEIRDSFDETISPLQTVISRVKEMQNILDEVRDGNYDNMEFERMQGVTSETLGNIDILMKALNQARDKEKVVFARRQKDLDDANNAYDKNEAGWEVQSKINQTFVDDQVLKNKIRSTIQLSSAIGQLGFAWSSFQNLGSLWANEKTDTGEKVLQTVMNLSMALPNMVSAFQSVKAQNLKDAKDIVLNIGNALKNKISNGFSDAAQAAGKFVSNISGAPSKIKQMGNDMRRFGASLESSYVSAQVLQLTLDSILPGLFIMASVASVVAESIAAQQEAASKATISAGEDATTEMNKILETKKSYAEIYQKYKEGKATSEELKQAAENLNKALGSQADTLSSANGQWETYNKNIEKATQTSLDQTIRTQNAALNEAGKKYAETPGWANATESQWNITDKTTNGNADLKEAYKNASSLSVSEINGDWAFVNGTSAAQRVKDMESMSDAFNKAIASGRQLGQDVSKFVEAQEKLNKLRDSHAEELNQYKTAQENLTSSLVQKYSSDQSDIKYQKGETTEQFKERIKQDLIAKGLVTGQDEAEAAAEGIIKGLSKSTANIGWIKDLANQNAFEDANKKYDSLSDEQKKVINRGFGNFSAGYDKSKYIQLMASIDEDSSTEQISNQLKRIKSNISQDDKTLELITDYGDAYKDKNGYVNRLGSIWDQYDKDESGGFDNQEAAKILAEHPEYAGYLTKVGEQYQLNQQALDDWNESIKEQNQLVDDNMGGTKSFENYADILNSVQNRASHSQTHEYSTLAPTEGVVEEQAGLQSIDSQLDSLVSKNEELNQSLAEGKITTQEYFDSMSKSIEGSGLYDALDSLDGKFDETTDYAEEMVSVLGAEVSDALVQSNKRFVEGKESVSDYIKDLQGGIEIQKKLTATTYNLQKSQDGLYEAVDKNDQAAVNAADSLNQLSRTQTELAAALEISDTLENNVDLLEQYTDSAGNLTSGILDDSRFNDYINSLTQSLVDFAATSEDNFNAIADGLANIANVSVDEMTSLLNTAINGTAEESAEAMAQIVDMTGMSADQVSQMTQLAMNNTAGALVNAQQAIGQVLTALGNMIKSFNYNIEFEPYIKGPANGKWIDIENGKINLPTFGFNARGKGGGSVAAFASALNNAGGYFTNAGNTAARAKSLGAYKHGGVGNIATPQGSRGIGGGSGRGKGGGGGGGKGGGGKGGGSGKSYEPKTKEYEKDEVDRYERVNALLSAVGEDLSVIQKEEKRLTGKELLRNLEAQIPLLQKQILLYHEKLKIQKEEAKELREQLQAQYGLAFDTEGFIANYQQIHDQLLDKVNNLISQYNSTSSEDGQKTLEKQITDAKKELDNFNKTYKRYDTLWSKDLKDTQKQIEDITDSIEDLQIEAFNKSVKTLDNIKDIQKTLETFQHNMNRGIDKNPFKELVESGAKLQKYFDIKTANKYFDEMIKNYSRLQQKATEQSAKDFYQRKIDELKAGQKSQGKGTMEVGGTGYFDMAWQNGSEILNQLKQYEETGQSEIFGKNGKGLYDSAKDIFNQMSKLLEDYWSDIDEVHSKLMDAISDISDRMDKRKDQYSAIADELEHIANISELLHGDKAYEEQNRILAAQQANYQAQLNEYKQQLEIWKDMQSNMWKGSEEWNTVQEKITSATKDMNNLVKTSLENLQKQYSNAIKKITDAWSGKAMGNDLEWIKTEWELINRNADYYLDKTNKAYNIQKLQGKYLDLLDGTSDLKLQQMITNQMREQLGYLRNKTNLSAYDVQYAQAQLEILQKRIALEEAQRNKSQMKLRRDSQGNYSYVYTADKNNTRAAQEDLLDSQNNAYNLSKEQMKQTQSDSLSALTEAKSQIDDIWTSANLALDEKKKRTQTIIDSLKEYLAATGEQLGTSEKNIINDYIGMFNTMTEENRSGMKDIYDQIVQGNKDAFDQIDTRWSTSITNWLQNIEDFNKQTDGMFDNLIGTAENYQKQTKDLSELAGKNFDDISQSLNNCVDSTKELSSSTAEFIQQLKNDSGVVQDYEHRIEKMAGKIVDANNSMKAYNQQVNELGNKLTAKEQENANLLSQNQNLQSKIDEWERQQNGGGYGSGGGGAGGSANDATAWGIAQAIWTYGWQSGWGNDPIRSSKLKNAYGNSFARKVQDYINQYWQSGKLVNYDSLAYSSYKLIGYDTGGYTGSWNNSSDGRVALLHQKELVLNAEDTKNILSAVQAVRGFASVIKTGIMETAFATLGNAVNGIGSVGLDNNIKQDVHITAEFPNASSTKEIEDALLNLNERSWQYAFSK